jgi:threonine dehydratase
MATPTLADVYRARQVVGRYLPPTPLLRARGLSERTGCEVHVKYENVSPIRSFKARGGIYCASRLGPEAAGLACASTGNHGQGMAYGARLFGKRAVVVVPEGANPQKIAAIRDLGADLRVHGPHLDAANEEAKRIAAAEHLVFAEDGEHPDVMLGCATLGLEVVEQWPDYDDLIVPVGGGNLLAAVALVTKAVRPEARLTGVQSSAAPAVFRSWQEEKPLRLDPPRTFAGGLATSVPGLYTFPFIRDGVDDIVLVEEEELQDAAIVLLQETGHLPEGAGAAALAALLADPPRYAGRRVVLILSGGNFEAAIWERVRRPAMASAR